MIYDSKRKLAWRNAMVAGINAGLDQGLFGLGMDENFWPGNNTRNTHVYLFSIGDIPAEGSCHDAGYGELSIHVALWPKKLNGEHFVRASGAGFLAGQVYASSWLERKTGCWLQFNGCSKWNFACRKHLIDVVAGLSIEPKGFVDHGRFMM